MDETLYTTSFTLYSLPLPTPRHLLTLLSSHETALKTHATKLYNHLISTSRRPAYEVEEEKEKVGSLRSCDIAAFPTGQGIIIAIIYDGAIYKFVIYASSQSISQTQLPLLLAKANASLTRRVFAYLSDAFHLPSDPEPLKLSSHLLLSSLENYISSLRNSLDHVAEKASILSLLRDIIGTLKITVTVNMGCANANPTGKNLRTIDLDVSSEGLYQLLGKSIAERPGPRSRKRDEIPKITFLPSLRDYLADRTGLILPITIAAVKKPLNTNVNGAEPADEPALRVTRIQSTALAIGMEGRLKFSNKPVEMMNAVPGLTSGDENVVKVANNDLLEAIVMEAERVQNPGWR